MIKKIKTLLFLAAFIAAGYYGWNYYFSRGGDLGIPSYARIIEKYDDRGSFLGSGRLWLIAGFSGKEKEEFEGKIANDPEWHPLPLPDAIIQARGLLTADNGNKVMPVDVTDGYYYFRDNELGTDPKEVYHPKQPLMNRVSSDFTLRIYDKGEGLLYVFRMDM